MKHFLPLILLLALLMPTGVKAQLPDGATAPDWTLTDIFGQTHHLYDLLDQGKMVAIDFSATWCGPCWNYMLSGALEDFWDEYGPNGTNQAQVFFIEADQSTGLADLYGQTAQSQGNWVANIPYPIIDLQVGENTDIDYQISYYPTLYAVCSDKKVYELGQVPASEWAEFIQSCSLSADVDNVEEAVCFGDGSISLDVSGGVNPISYDWSNGSHAASLQNLGAGTYSVTVTEGNGKDVVLEDIVVTGADAPISLSDSEIEHALCYGSPTGSVSVQLQDGVPPYSYDWSNGATSQNINNVPAGLYTLNATDNNGCTFEDAFEVTEPDELVAEYETTPDYCDQSNGTVTLEISGGTGDYDISASDGTVYGDQIIDLSAGSVTAFVEDENGCMWEEDIDIEYTPEHSIYFSPDPVVTCVQPTTVVTGYVQGGSDDYEYEWSTSNGHIVGQSNQPSVTVDQPGTYSLIVYDLVTGCQADNAVAVASTINPPAVSAGDDTPVSCEDLQPELSASGAASLVISWATSNGHIVSGGDTYTPTVDAPGTYIIQVTNPANSCINHDTVMVLDNVVPAQAEYQYQTSGLTMIGTDISGGSNLSGWTWTFGDGNSSTDPNVVHTYTADGTYEVCLSVQNGCGTSSTCHQVAVASSGSSIAVDATIQNVGCHADSTGSIVLIVNGGTGNYSYSWTGPEGASYSSPSIDSLLAGTYQVVVSDDQGNLFIGEYSVSQPDPIILNGSTVIDNICYGQSGGSVAVDIAGGVAPYSYAFNGGAPQSENSIGNLPAGLVECLVSDANGCPFLAGPYTIQEPPALTHEAAITSVRCYGEANGAINLSVAGGVAPYSYLWNTGGVTTPEINQLPAGQYSCQVTDHNGCISEANVLVAQPDQLTAGNIQTVDASGPAQNNGSITIEILGGTAPYTVTWSNGATGTTIDGLVPGEYAYTIVDANGCITNSAAPVIINGTTSTTGVDWSRYVSILPNPSSGNVLVSWKGLDAHDGTLTLTTLQGSRLATRTFTGNSGQWDLTPMGLSSGVYIVLLEMNQQAIPFKLVVL